jgi:hypothetical protein
LMTTPRCHKDLKTPQPGNVSNYELESSCGTVVVFFASLDIRRRCHAEH